MKKLTAIIMVITLTLSLCNSLSIASETQIVDDTIPLENVLETKETEEKEYIEENIDDIETATPEEDVEGYVFDYMEDTVNERNDEKNDRKYYVIWRAGSKTSYASYTSEDSVISNDEYKSAILAKTKQLYSMIVENGICITDDWEQYRRDYNEISVYDQYVDILVSGGTEKEYSFEMVNDIVFVNMPNAENSELIVQKFKISNPQAIIDYLADMSDIFGDSAEEFENIFIEETYTNEKLVEELMFDFVLNEENKKGLFYKFGDVGETLQCVIARSICYDSNNLIHEKYTLTVKGSKKSYTFANYFGGKYYFSYNRLIKMTFNSQGRKYIIELDAGGDEKTLTSAYLGITYSSPKSGTDEVWVSDLSAEYRQYLSELDVEILEDRTMHGIYTYDAEAEMAKKKEATKKRSQLGIPLNTFKVNALAQTMLEIDAEAAPQWYKDLGRNVSLMILSVTREEKLGRKTAPMLRFRGSAGEIWFNFISKESYYQGREIEYTWGSVVSFDALKTDEDHTVEEILTGKSICTGGDNSVFESYEFNIGENTYKFGVSDLNIIGCDELTQNLIYDMDYYYDDSYWDGLDDFMSNMKYGSVYHY